MEKQTAVEWLISQIVEDQIIKAKSVGEWEIVFQQAKQMEKEQKIKAQIEILRKIGNNGMNAPLYGILKDNVIILEEQLTKI